MKQVEIWRAGRLLCLSIEDVVDIWELVVRRNDLDI